MGNAFSSKKPKTKVAVTFPEDDDHGQVVVEANRDPAKVHRSRLLRKRVKCFMDISIDDEPAGRLVVELRPDVNPRTAENFRALCTGETGIGYKGCKFHKIIPGYVVQSGDVDFKGTEKEGDGGRSIYGRTFADEDMKKLLHDKPGVISMANRGPHTSSSQFMIIVDEEGCDWLDGKHTCFGTVLPESMELLKKIEDCGEVFYREEKRRARVVKTCVIADCGQL